MLNNYLPASISNALDKIPYNSLCELRIRANNPTLVNILGENYYLCSTKLSKSSESAIDVSLGEIQGILSKVSNNSMYAINDQLIEGYVSIGGGIRVGVCGEAVYVDGKIKTLKNISSINFRFPHMLKNCSLNIFPYIVNDNGVKSTLIVSPPGAGKTTYLRDLVYQLSNYNNLINVLVVDERQELSCVFDGQKVSNLKNVDIYKNSTKEFGFINGIRSMKPDVIVTDEINIEKDLIVLQNALTSGVKIIASIHADSINDLRNKPMFGEILKSFLFERFVLLSTRNGVGTVEGVYDENLRFIGV